MVSRQTILDLVFSWLGIHIPFYHKRLFRVVCLYFTRGVSTSFVSCQVMALLLSLFLLVFHKNVVTFIIRLLALRHFRAAWPHHIYMFLDCLALFPVLLNVFVTHYISGKPHYLGFCLEVALFDGSMFGTLCSKKCIAICMDLSPLSLSLHLLDTLSYNLVSFFLSHVALFLFSFKFQFIQHLLSCLDWTHIEPTSAVVRFLLFQTMLQHSRVNLMHVPFTVFIV